MKYLSVGLGLLACAALVSSCGGGTLGGGSRLLITREADGNRDIYLLSSTGATLQRITSDAQSDEAPRWSPDGTRVAFIRRDTGAGSQALYFMNADGSNPQNLYPGGLAVTDQPFYPAWLNNDMVFFRRGASAPAALAKRSIGGGDVTAVTTPGTDFDDVPTVSPDGTKIAFVRVSGSSSALYIANSDGTNAHSVITDAGRTAPAWSPDGTKLAFVRIVDGTNWEIHVAAADGSNPVRLTNNAAQDFAPVWSPDSSKLLFASARDGNNELYRMNADGSNVLRLTNTAASEIPYGWR